MKPSETKVLKLTFVVMTLMWMIIIFGMSNKPADESENMSHNVGKFVGRLIIADFDEWSLERQEEFAAAIDYPVRKMAHASEYFILGMLLVGVMTLDKKIYAWGMAILYAVSDEIHQLFIPGRSCQLKDILIDSFGTFLGVCFIAFISFTISLIRNRRKKS